MSKPSWNEQDPADVATAFADINARWEYVGPNPRIKESLEKYGKVILKTERHRLKKLWEAGGRKEDFMLPQPSSMTSEQWAKLVKHFQSENARTKSEIMVEARAEVKGVNPYGRAGVAGKAAKVRATSGSTPSKVEIMAAHKGKAASELSDGTKVRSLLCTY